ncbi:MAG: RidA family protein [bacterium]|nr:RidA family protein [bacterium]
MKRWNTSTGTRWEALVGYSRAVRAGKTIHVTGTVAIGADNHVVGLDDAYEQTCQIFRNIDNALGDLGAGLDDVVRTRIYVTDIERDWQQVGKAHKEFVGHVAPATTMVEVSRLIDARFLVEIEVDAIADLGPTIEEQSP